MKKRSLSKLTIKRISTSPYFKESFALLEKKTIEEMAQADVLTLNSSQPADVLITNTHTDPNQISAKDLEKCQLIIHPNSGYDNFTADFVSRSSCPIIIGNPIRAQAVSNFILSALFSRYSLLPNHLTWDRERKWPRKLLSELSVLIIGYGHIGHILEQSLRPLVAKLQIFDPYAGKNDYDAHQVDVLIPACSLTSMNKHFINKELLTKLKNDFTLINAARGPLVKTSDLIEVLKSSPHAFAYLDVFEEEPADFSIFKGLTNIQLSSHIAGVYANIDQVTAHYVASVIADFQTIELDDFKKKYQSVLLNERVKNGMLI